MRIEDGRISIAGETIRDGQRMPYNLQVSGYDRHSLESAYGALGSMGFSERNGELFAAVDNGLEAARQARETLSRQGRRTGFLFSRFFQYDHW